MKLDKISGSIESRIPSLQDLVSATAMWDKSNMPSAIFPSSGGHIIIEPVPGRKPNINQRKYQEIIRSTIENNDLDIIVNGLREMGFNISGKVNNKRIGKLSQVDREVEKTGSQIPRSGSREIGGVRAVDQDVVQTNDYVEGNPGSVEIEVPIDDDDKIIYHTHPDIDGGKDECGGYEPKDALDGTDKTNVGRKRPKLTNNNYFPGKNPK